MSTTEAPRAGRYVGARVQRREDPRRLTGHGVYVDDIRLPGMLHATFVRSPLAARGLISSIDVEPARLVPGVVAICTRVDLNADATGVLWDWTSPDFGFPRVYPLAEGSVRYVGDPVAIVVAASRYVAEDAAELIEVDDDPLPAVVGRERALTDEHSAHDELESNLAWAASTPEDPSLEAGFARATTPHLTRCASTGTSPFRWRRGESSPTGSAARSSSSFMSRLSGPSYGS